MEYFNHKKVLITGASSGLGEHLAIELNKRGAHVILVARNEKELTRVLNQLDKTSPSIAKVFDVSKYDQGGVFIADLLKEIGTIDILINNAGISQRSLAVDTSFEDEKKIIDLNLYGVLALTKACLPEIIKNKGQIVVINSVMGKINTKYRSAYAASKHALTGYFDCLRIEVEDQGVSVCNIMPGFVATNITKNSIGSTADIINNSANDKGLSPASFAIKAADAIAKRKREVIIGGFKEAFAVWFKKLAPRLFDFFIKKQKVI